jgi:L-ascorbate metabolism protein UlaG (beta-lactamase superfamily)
MLRKLGIGIAVLLLAVIVWVAWLLNDVPDLDTWQSLELPAVSGPIGPGEVRVRFLGVSTLVIRDEDTTLLVDGFLSRPGLLSVLVGKVEPDPERIAEELARAGVESAAAVIVVHSHYDHAMDAPEVAKRTGAVVVGSESTANVSRGWGLPESHIVVPQLGEVLRYGGFEVTLLESVHFPHGMAMGEISEPLIPPAAALDYLDGGSFSVAISHPETGTILVQGSAGWKPGALVGKRFDVVLLGVGGLGSRRDAYRSGYYEQIVRMVEPSLVIPIHWDDFTRPLSEPLRPMPRIQDDLDVTMEFLLERTGLEDGRDLAMLPPLREVKLLPRPGPGVD